MEFRIHTFEDHEPIPKRHALEGENISPALSWSVPAGCKEFAIICEDPDAPKTAGQDHPFTHWLIYNIPFNVTSLPERIPLETQMRSPVAAAQGLNSFGKIGYYGPMPPVDSGVHHYVFTIYALGGKLKLEPGADKKTLMKAMRGYTIATAHITGTYERRSKGRIKRMADATGISESDIVKSLS